jgi:hypothetical protein
MRTLSWLLRERLFFSVNTLWFMVWYVSYLDD